MGGSELKVEWTSYDFRATTTALFTLFTYFILIVSGNFYWINLISSTATLSTLHCDSILVTFCSNILFLNGSAGDLFDPLPVYLILVYCNSDLIPSFLPLSINITYSPLCPTLAKYYLCIYCLYYMLLFGVIESICFTARAKCLVFGAWSRIIYFEISSYFTLSIINFNFYHILSCKCFLSSMKTNSCKLWESILSTLAMLLSTMAV